MRNVRAKAIRKLAQSGNPQTTYTEQKRPARYVPNGELLPDGTQRLVAYQPVTRRLDINCDRRVYQLVKRQYAGNNVVGAL